MKHPDMHLALARLILETVNHTLQHELRDELQHELPN